MRRLAWPVLFALQLVCGDPSGAQSEGARTREERAAAVLTAIEGRVFTPSGLPARGAIVTSSAGGKAFAGEDGRFLLAVELPLATSALDVNAVLSAGSAALTSRTRVAVTPGATNASGVLWLMSGGCQPRWVSTFGGVNDIADWLSDAVVFDDGHGSRLYACGGISRAGAEAAGGVASWDGVSWSAAGVGMNGAVLSLAVFDDGSGPVLYAGGDFTTADGDPASHVARWDGTSWSALGAGTNDVVQSFAVFDDGSGAALYAGGLFTLAGGASANRVARWDGSSWSAVGSGMDRSVISLTVADDGRGPALFAGGSFTLAGGIAASRVARWDGASWSALGSGVDGKALALLEFDDGDGPALYAGGEFTHAGGGSAAHIAKWDGTGWSALKNGTDGPVGKLALFDEGNGTGPTLFVSGGFTFAGGVVAPRLARWDGTIWSVLGNQNQQNVSADILAVFDDGTGGGPALYTDDRLRWDGTNWTTIPTPRALDGATLALTSFDDGGGGGPALYAGGRFAGDGVSSLNHVARWDGASWDALAGGVNGDVVAFAVLDEPSGPALYAGGNFNRANGIATGNVARWDGTSWSAVGGGVGGPLYALAAFDDGTGGGPALIAGGGFGGFLSSIAKWGGATWQPLGSGVFGSVRSLVSFDDGGGPALYAGGSFSSASGVSAANIARWNGSSWSSLGSGIGGSNAVVYCQAVFDDGTGSALYVGGEFSLAGGVGANRVARWDGSSWSALGAGTDWTVLGLASFDDGTGPALYACGKFTVAGGVAANLIARWDGSVWTPVGSGLGLPPPLTNEGAVAYALAVVDDASGDPALIAGGSFLGALDSHDSRIARWQGCLDTAAPVLSLPASVVALDSWVGPPGEVVTFSVTASDDIDPSPTVVCTPPSGSFFAPGTTLVHCTATDASGKQSTGDFPVIVQPKTRGRAR